MVLSDKKKILLVDDDEWALSELFELCKKAGYDVSMGKDGREALQSIEKDGPPMILVTDLVMPKIGGMELIKTLRDAGHSFPIVVLSGRGGDLGEVLRVGATMCFSKPFRACEVVDTLARLAKRVR